MVLPTLAAAGLCCGWSSGICPGASSGRSGAVVAVVVPVPVSAVLMTVETIVGIVPINLLRRLGGLTGAEVGGGGSGEGGLKRSFRRC